MSSIFYFKSKAASSLGVITLLTRPPPRLSENYMAFLLLASEAFAPLPPPPLDTGASASRALVPSRAPAPIAAASKAEVPPPLPLTKDPFALLGIDRSSLGDMSAIKRAYNKKDFDSFIPGHGGLTDRMDCQFIMALAAFVHYNTFVRATGGESLLHTSDEIMQAVGMLALDQQQELYAKLGAALGVGGG